MKMAEKRFWSKENRERIQKMNKRIREKKLRNFLMMSYKEQRDYELDLFMRAIDPLKKVDQDDF